MTSELKNDTSEAEDYVYGIRIDSERHGFSVP